MRLELEGCVVRSWEEGDADHIASHANNRKVWINLRDTFPHPYTGADARNFIRAVRDRDPETHFAIEVEGEAIGGIGLVPGEDIDRLSAEIGYWVGEAFWGRGIATEALRGVTAYAIETHGLSRVFAVPFEWNAASVRVLEKAGYLLEGRMRRSAIKDGRIIDQLLYAYVVTG